MDKEPDMLSYIAALVENQPYVYGAVTLTVSTVEVTLYVNGNVRRRWELPRPKQYT